MQPSYDDRQLKSEQTPIQFCAESKWAHSYLTNGTEQRLYKDTVIVGKLAQSWNWHVLPESKVSHKPGYNLTHMRHYIGDYKPDFVLMSAGYDNVL